MTPQQKIYARIGAFTVFIFVLSSWALPTVALSADGGGTQSWWQALLVPILGIAGLFISGFLAAGLLKLVKLIEKKWDIDIPDAFEEIMVEKAKWAVAWAEEKAEKRLLHGDGAKTSGADKINDVVNLLTEFAEARGYGQDWSRDKVEKLAEGVLHLERDVSVGSSGDRNKKLEAKKSETPT